MKKANFFIHYEPSDASAFDLEVFGKSIIGFNYLLRDIYKIANIDGDVEIKALQPEKGSIIVPLLIEISLHGQVIFNTLPDLTNFLQISDPKLMCYANDFFSQHGYSLEMQTTFWQSVLMGETEFQKGFNLFAEKRPGEFWALSSILGGTLLLLGKKFLPIFYKKIIEKTRNIKKSQFPDNETPKEYFGKLKKLPFKYKIPLLPLREGQVSEIGFSLDGKKKNISESDRINGKDFGEFLPDNEEILPEYTNGLEYDFNGEIKNLQSSRGDFLKIDIRTSSGKFLLTAKPWEGHTTEEFIQFYKKKVKFRAEVLRESVFQIPKLKIVPSSMELEQSELC